MLLLLLLIIATAFGNDDFSMFEPLPEENTLVVKLVGGSSYSQIIAMGSEDAFLAVCTHQMTGLLSGDEAVECIDIEDGSNGVLEVTLYSEATGNLDAVQDELLANGVDMLTYDMYELELDLVTFTQEFEQVFSVWSGDNNLDLFPLGCYNTLKFEEGLDVDIDSMQCSVPYESAEGKVMVDFTVTMDQEMAVKTAVESGTFTVAGFNDLNAQVEQQICEKIAQANIVMMISDSPAFVTQPGDVEIVNNNCFNNYTMEFVQDRRNIDELAGNHLETTFAVFADSLQDTETAVALIQSYGYYTVMNAENVAQVQNARAGNGCECDIDQDDSYVEIVVGDYDISGAGLVVGLAGVLIFFVVCVCMVVKRDALFTDEEVVNEKNQKDEDALAKIKKKEQEATSEKKLPKWTARPFNPSGVAMSKLAVKSSENIEVDTKEAVEVHEEETVM